MLAAGLFLLTHPHEAAAGEYPPEDGAGLPLRLGVRTATSSLPPSYGLPVWHVHPFEISARRPQLTLPPRDRVHADPRQQPRRACDLSTPGLSSGPFAYP